MSSHDNGSIRSSLLTTNKLNDFKNQNRLGFSKLVDDIDKITQKTRQSHEYQMSKTHSFKHDDAARPQSVLSQHGNNYKAIIMKMKRD